MLRLCCSSGRRAAYGLVGAGRAEPAQPSRPGGVHGERVRTVPKNRLCIVHTISTGWALQDRRFGRDPRRVGPTVLPFRPGQSVMVSPSCSVDDLLNRAADHVRLVLLDPMMAHGGDHHFALRCQPRQVVLQIGPQLLDGIRRPAWPAVQGYPCLITTSGTSRSGLAAFTCASLVRMSRNRIPSWFSSRSARRSAACLADSSFSMRPSPRGRRCCGRRHVMIART